MGLRSNRGVAALKTKWEVVTLKICRNTQSRSLSEGKAYAAY
jgi:hypothetical protein